MLARGGFEPVAAAELREARLDAELLPLSDQGKRAVMILLQGETDHVVSLQADAMPGSSATLALTTVLRRKARVVDAVTQRSTLQRQRRSRRTRCRSARSRSTSRCFVRCRR